MKKMIAASAAAVFILGSASFGMAGKSSAELGQELFNDAGLGGSKNESSCSSCHSGGKGLESAASSKKLSKLVNNCLVNKMVGEKIDGRTVAMRSLKMYIKSLHN